MRIVIIHGQNHKGSSYHIGRNLAERIATKEDITELFLPKDLNHFCIGCYKCVEDETKCPYFEEKEKIAKTMEMADILVFTTPTYCMRASAPMKSFIDLFFTNWMPHKPKKCMFDKKAVVLSTAAGTGSKSAIKDITTSLFYWGVPYIKSYGISVQAACWEDVNVKKKEKIDRDITKLAQKLKSGRKPKVPFKTKFMFNLMRTSQKSGMGAGPVEEKYWQDNGWLGKSRPWKD